MDTWRSFPKVPNLLQYVGSGSYYARIKLRGKTIRRSLDTDVFTTAKLKLLDFLKEERKKPTAVAPPTFAEAQQLYEHQLDNDPAVKPQSRQYRRWCIRKLELSWPGLKALRLDEIKPEACREWAATARKTTFARPCDVSCARCWEFRELRCGMPSAWRSVTPSNPPESCG
jgi:hypothetical protein